MASKSTWTTTYVQESKPIKYWFKTGQYNITFNFLSLVLWLMRIFVGGKNGALDGVYVAAMQYSLVWPVIVALYTQLTKSYYYSKCSDLSTTQFDGTTTTVTQYVSCRDGTDAEFGSSGTTAK